MAVLPDTQAPVNLSFAGLRLVNAEARRTPGVDPDFASVTMARATFEQINVQTDAALFGSPLDMSADTGPREQEESPPPSVFDIRGDLRVRGDLIIERDGKRVTLASMFVRDEGVEQIHDDREGVDMVRVSLADIRYFWRVRGELWGEHNLLGFDGRFQKHSVSNGPVPLWDLLEDALLALPGRLPLRAPAAIEERLRKVTVNGVRWHGLQPVEVLSDLLRAHSLVLHLPLDSLSAVLADEKAAPSSVSLDNTKARTLVGAAGETVTVAPGTYALRARSSPTFRPSAVRALFGRVVREATSELVPVGVNATNGRIEPLEDAARSWGLTLADLGRWVMLSPQEQETAFGGKLASAVKEVSSWAFRLFQLPEREWNRLPLEPVRVSGLRLQQREQVADPRAPSERGNFAGSPTLDAETFQMMLVFPDVPAETIDALREDMEVARAEYEAQDETLQADYELAVLKGLWDRVSRVERQRAALLDNFLAQDRARIRTLVSSVDDANVPGASPAGRPGQRVSAQEAQAVLASLDERLRRKARIVVENAFVRDVAFTFYPDRGLVRTDTPTGFVVPLATTAPRASERSTSARETTPAENRRGGLIRGEVSVPTEADQPPVTDAPRLFPLDTIERTRMIPSRVRLTYAFTDSAAVRYDQIRARRTFAPSTERATAEANCSFLYAASQPEDGPEKSEVEVRLLNVVSESPPEFVEPSNFRTLQPRLIALAETPLLVDLEGRSNYADLEAEARKTAERVLSQPDVLYGASCRSPFPLPIETGDVVREVGWRMDGTRALTEWHENAVGETGALRRAPVRTGRTQTLPRYPNA